MQGWFETWGAGVSGAPDHPRIPMTPPMMAGPRVSPRRGFTIIEETNMKRVGPVVVRLDDSPRSVVALRIAA